MIWAEITGGRAENSPALSLPSLVQLTGKQGEEKQAKSRPAGSARLCGTSLCPHADRAGLWGCGSRTALGIASSPHAGGSSGSALRCWELSKLLCRPQGPVRVLQSHGSSRRSRGRAWRCEVGGDAAEEERPLPALPGAPGVGSGSVGGAVGQNSSVHTRRGAGGAARRPFPRCCRFAGTQRSPSRAGAMERRLLSGEKRRLSACLVCRMCCIG